MRKLCIVGCGQVATWRIGTILQQGFDVTGCVDGDVDKALSLAALAGRNGLLPKYLTELDDPKLYDLAYIATPNGVHAACAAPFIDAGVPVVIEKPLALAERDLRMARAPSRQWCLDLRCLQ